jgi:hypothetical protein
MTLPQVPFGDHQISRMVVGGNPIRGNSHLSQEYSRQMGEYFTTETVLESWFEAEKQGVTAMQSRGDQIVMDWVDAYREAGGTLQWIVQTASEWNNGDVPDNIRAIAEHDPIAIYHHGSRTDSLWKNGQIDELKDIVQRIQDRGILAGIGSHMPEVIEYVDEQDWGVDFYMTCAYNLSRQNHVSALAGGKAGLEIYDDADRDRMLGVIQKTATQCIYFKIFAAGRKCANQAMIREVIQHSFDNIKPHDVIDVGYFQRDRNEIGLNANHVRAVLGDGSDELAISAEKLSSGQLV